jgi:hypothetical protein
MVKKPPTIGVSVAKASGFNGLLALGKGTKGTTYPHN